MSKYLNIIRNFVIIAHIDHGKSTLADRFLELTKTVDIKKMRPQYLDLMELEQERGITIKLQPARMEFEDSSAKYILNLVDTPGHIDFNYEVSRALMAVEGAILLVDATKGVQAQTVGNLEIAKKQNLVIIPVINKIDLPFAEVERTKKELSNLLNVDESKILKISAKQGFGVDKLLKTVIEKIPYPIASLPLTTDCFQALIFDSKYDSYKGVIVFVRVFNGKIKKGEKIYLLQNKVRGEVLEVGVFKPEFVPIAELQAGEIGYIATGIKEPKKVRIGDTVTSFTSLDSDVKIEPLSGYGEPKPMVFLSVYPANPNDFELLKTALEKLKLNDSSLIFKPELKESLGRGFQCGFLGLLHADIVAERLKREFDLELVLSSPSVAYKIITSDNKEIFIYTPHDWPETPKIKESQEIWASLQILTPLDYIGAVLKLLENTEARQYKINYLSAKNVELIYEISLREIITKNFYDKLKGVSQGFASMNYEVLGWRTADLVKLDILILNKEEQTLSQIIPAKEAHKEGKKIVEKLKINLPPQLFAVPLQAAVKGKIIARETIRAQRRDVIAPLYGGDYSRKRKLLEKQKKGKIKLKERGRIRIPPEIYLKILT